MVLRVDAYCSWHYRQGSPDVPALPTLVSINGEGGLYDLCQECETTLLGPFFEMRAAHLARANRTDDLPDGWVQGTAWLGGRSAALPAGYGPSSAPAITVTTAVETPAPQGNLKRLAKDESVIGGRANNGGPRKNTGPVPKRRTFLCPCSWCDHPGLGSYAGVLDHMRRCHQGISPTLLIRQVDRCGLCPRGQVKFKNVTDAGRHMNTAHPDLVPEGTKNGAVALLVSAVRRAGDPHGTLAKMDALAQSGRSAGEADSQLALGESSDDLATAAS